MPPTTPLRVGYVPEHFSTPIFFAQAHSFFTSHSLSPTLLPFPSGTGAMSLALAAGELDLAIGLTEGWIAALLNTPSIPYKLVGEYVRTPLRWAISTGAAPRVEGLDAVKKLGVSRKGSGSYVMGFVLAEREGWKAEVEGRGEEPYEFVVLNDFKRLRDGVNEGTADAFMWEYFTTKKYYDNGEIRMLGDIYTPWPSWHVVAHDTVEKEVLGRFAEALNEGVRYFNAHKEEAVEWIAGELDYSREDATEWLQTVEFAEDTGKVRKEVVERTAGILKSAGVVGREVEVQVEQLVRGGLV